MKKLHRNVAIGGVIVVILGLFVWGRMIDPARTLIGLWKENGVECLSQGHQNLAQHIHQDLEIFVDDVPESVPADVGILPTCMAELHTHDVSGKIHVESVEAGKTFTLEQFLKMSGRSFDREGYTADLYANGVLSISGGKLVLEDTQKIVINYRKQP